MSKTSPGDLDDKTSGERLTEHEAKYMTIGPAISSLTFFRGNTEEARALLQERLAGVVRYNPWLAGKLIKSKGSMELQYPDAPSDNHINNLFNPSVRGGKARKPPVVDSTMDYFELCKAVSGSAAEILKGSDCVNKPEALTALTIIPDAQSPKDTFAVVFSVSHAIADGFTYYKLLSMLSSGAEMVALSATRKHDIGPQSKTAMGEKESAFAYAGTTVCNIICSMLCGRKALIESYYVEPARIESYKGQAKDQGVDFVSTNDVLCSTFANATQARVLLMPLNFRERLPDFTAKDAGNYEGALVFGPEDYAEPSLIRKTLMSGPPAYSRQIAKPLPGGCEGMRCRISMVTNWTFPFFSEMRIDGCQQMLHIPHCDVNMIPFDVAVVYRPKAGQLAVTFFTRALNSNSIKAECPVGGMVSNAEQSFQGGVDQASE